MKINHLRGLVEWSLMAALVLGTGAIAQAQQDKDKSQPEGRIVQIGPADGNQAQDNDETTPAPQPAPAPEQGQPIATHYWIGIVGGPVSPALRAQLDIPENQGIVVREVRPDSPAAKAGLKKYDVLLRADDNDLSDMGDLVDLVRTTGEQQTRFSLEVLHHGQRETLWVTPEKRPAGEEQPGEFGGGEMPGGVRQFLQQFRGNEPFEFRSFGPGVIIGRGFGLGQLPKGVSVTIQKQDDQPPHIVVKRGDQKWDINADDPEALRQLPEDLRPLVEAFVHGNGVPEFVVPHYPQPTPPISPFGELQLQKRLDQMQKQLEHLQQQMQGLQHQSEQEAK